MQTPRPLIENESRSTRRFVLALTSSCVLLAGPTLLRGEITPSYLPHDDREVINLEKVSINGQSGHDDYAVKRSFTATKTDTALLNVPQAITVITRELIEDQAMRSIGDVTRYVPGVGIAQGEGNRDTPVLRGNSTTADFFVDGVRDDVQYFRGGSGGLINRMTKVARGHDQQEFTLQAGSWSQLRATFDAGQALSAAFAYRVTGLYEDSDSYRDGVTLKRYGVNPTFAYTLSSATTLRFGYEHFHDERVADRGVSSYQGRPLATDASTFFGDPAQSEARVSVNTAFAQLEHKFAPGFSVRNHTRFSGYGKFYQNVFPGAVNAAGTSVAISAYNNGTDRDNLFSQTDVIYTFESGSVKHQVLAGLELGRQVTDNQRNTGYFTTISPTTTSVLEPVTAPRTTLPVSFRPSATDADNHGVARTVAIYAQDQITLSPQLQAIVGARLEQFSVDFDNHRTASSLARSDRMISPRAGLVYKPTDQISLYTSYTMTYVPRAGEQLASLSLTNQSLAPEEFTNYEIGLKWDVRRDLAFTVATYQLDRSNVVIPDPADATRSLLVDGQRARGVEIGFTGRITRQWVVAGGYAYQDGQIKTTQSATVVAGARLAQLPRHTFSLWNRYDLNRTWGLGLGAIYRDQIFASTDNTVTLPSFTRFDAAVFCRLNERIRAQLNVENVFDHSYFASAHNNNNITPGSPRAIRVSLTTTF
jgi:catecholate siderophore receptor